MTEHLSDAPIRYAADGAVATITLADPARRNALGARSLRLLGDAFDQALDDPGVRVVVLAADGSAFCAGVDLDEADDEQIPALYAAVLETMRDATKPIVARVQGPVVGGGNGLVASADVVVASDDARFAFREVRIGAVPAVVAVPCLRRMRRGDATELMLTGAWFDADRARDAGLVQQVVAADTLDERVTEVCGLLLRGSPTALAITRQVLRDVPAMDGDQAMEWTAAVSAQVFASSEAQEGRAAFAEHRDPSWVATVHPDA